MGHTGRGTQFDAHMVKPTTHHRGEGRRVAERERAAEEVLSKNSMGKLVMLDDEVVNGT